MEYKREWDGYFNYEYDVQSVNNGIDIFEFSSIESEKRKMNVLYKNFHANFLEILLKKKK